MKLITDRLHRPTNISCIFHGKRILNCTYAVHDSIGYNHYWCDTRNWNRGKINNIHHGDCPDKIVDELNENAEESPLTKAGVCSHQCTGSECNGNILLTFFGKNVKKNLTYCHVAKLRQIIKPGKVRNLRVTAINSSSLSVTWRKPGDMDNDDDIYWYSVHWVGQHGATGNMTVTGKEKHTTVPIMNLRAGWKYDITVKARPEKKGFESEPSTIHNATMETFPASGPVVSTGSFSVQDMKYLAVYWKKIPENQRGGKIIEYEIRIGNSSFQVEATHHWSIVNLNGLNDHTTNVTLSAATKIGFSTRNTTLNISKSNLKHQTIAFVHRKSKIVLWNQIAVVQGINVRVHRCYGRQDISQHQLVDCRTEIEFTDVKNTSQSRLEWPDPPAPALPCVRCQWHYAVSVHVDNNTAGMVWNIDDPKHYRAPNVSYPDMDRPLKSAGLKEYKMIYFAVIPLVSVLLIAVCVFLCILMRKKLTCKSYIIILPDDGETMDELRCAVLDMSADKISPVTKETVYIVRDSGNESMERCDASHKTPESEHTCESEKTDIDQVTSIPNRPPDNEILVKADINMGAGTETVEEVAKEGFECTGGDCADDINESGVSDYRMQIVCDNSSMEGKPDSQDTDNDTSVLTVQEEEKEDKECLILEHQMRKIEMTVKRHSQDEDVSSLSSQSSSPKLASKPMATSYSELYVPVLEIESSHGSFNLHSKGHMISTTKYSSKTNSDPSLITISGNSNINKDVIDSFTSANMQTSDVLSHSHFQ